MLWCIQAIAFLLIRVRQQHDLKYAAMVPSDDESDVYSALLGNKNSVEKRANANSININGDAGGASQGATADDTLAYSTHKHEHEHEHEHDAQGQAWEPADIRRLIVKLTLLSAFQNGVRPAVLPFACLPYGDTSYHTVQTLILCVEPLGAVAAIFVQPGRGAFLGMTAAWGLTACYLITLAAMSPSPPLVHTSGGTILAIVTISGSSVLAFAKTAAILKIKNLADDKANAGKLLFYQGAAMQVKCLSPPTQCRAL